MTVLDSPTTSTSLAQQVARVRATFQSGHTRPLAWRRQQLEQMKAMLEENEEQLIKALRIDLGKPTVE